MRLRALLALKRFDEVRAAADLALAVVKPLSWRALEWRLRGSRAEALAASGDRHDADAERRAAVRILMAMAQTLEASLRTRFLAQPQAEALLAAQEQE
jgi:hypothetical protein